MTKYEKLKKTASGYIYSFYTSRGEKGKLEISNENIILLESFDINGNPLKDNIINKIIYDTKKLKENNYPDKYTIAYN